VWILFDKEEQKRKKKKLKPYRIVVLSLSLFSACSSICHDDGKRTRIHYKDF